MPKPKLLDRVRHRIRARHYSRRTEKAYVHWIRVDPDQALNALLFLYREVLEIELPWLDGLVQDVDFGTSQLAIRDGKGSKDRVTMLPGAIKEELVRYLEHVRRQHERDVTRGAGWVELPWALGRKYPNAGANGAGSGSFRRPDSTSTEPRASAAVTIFTSPSHSGRCGRPL